MTLVVGSGGPLVRVADVLAGHPPVLVECPWLSNICDQT